MYGWTGKIAKVDLSRSAVTELNTWDYAEQFLGGRGIDTALDATRLCNDYSICSMEIQNVLLWLVAAYLADDYS